MADESLQWTIALNKDGKAKRGEALRWLDAIAIPHAGKDCLVFPFFRDKSGYARLSGRKGPGMAYVYVAEKVYGLRPSASYECCHECGKGHLGCVNPNHLYWGTRSQNVNDRKTHGGFVPPPVHRGSAATSTKLNENDVRAIRVGLANGRTLKSLAIEFNVTITPIWGIKAGKTWTWVT